jgi:hypothetical protein
MILLAYYKGDCVAEDLIQEVAVVEQRTDGAVKTYTYNLGDIFEFSAKMPEELLVKAMTSTRPIFLTEDFMARVAGTTPEKMVRDLVLDLHREADPDDTDELLRWHYLYMDFENDFPRLLMMLEQPPAKDD